MVTHVTCPACHEAIEEQFRFCPFCGEPVPSDRAETWTPSRAAAPRATVAPDAPEAETDFIPLPLPARPGLNRRLVGATPRWVFVVAILAVVLTLGVGARDRLAPPSGNDGDISTGTSPATPQASPPSTSVARATPAVHATPDDATDPIASPVAATAEPRRDDRPAATADDGGRDVTPSATVAEAVPSRPVVDAAEVPAPTAGPFARPADATPTASLAEVLADLLATPDDEPRSPPAPLP